MEQAMATLSPGQLFLVLCGVLLAVAGFINAVGAAFDRMANWRHAAQAPNREQDTRLGDLERRMGDVERMLGNDKHSLDKINGGLEASFQVQLALLDHALNGNNIKQMQDARDGLYAYLSHPNKRKE